MSNRTEAAWRKLRHCHREATVTAPLLDSTHLSDNVGVSSAFRAHCGTHSLRRAPFRLENFPLPTKARLVVPSVRASVRPMHLFSLQLRS